MKTRHRCDQCALRLEQEPPCHAGTCPQGDSAGLRPDDAHDRAPRRLPAPAPQTPRMHKARLSAIGAERRHQTMAAASSQGLALITRPRPLRPLCVPDTQTDPALLRCHRSCGLVLMEGKTLRQQKGPSSPYCGARLTAAAPGRSLHMCPTATRAEVCRPPRPANPDLRSGDTGPQTRLQRTSLLTARVLVQNDLWSRSRSVSPNFPNHRQPGDRLLLTGQ